MIAAVICESAQSLRKGTRMSLLNWLLGQREDHPGRANTIARDTERMRKAMSECETAALLTIDYEIIDGDGRVRD